MASNEMGMGEGTLKKAAQLVSGAKQDFDRLSGELEGQIGDLRGKWAGSGGQAFFILHQAWTEKQKVVVSALNEFESVPDRHRQGRLEPPTTRRPSTSTTSRASSPERPARRQQQET